MNPIRLAALALLALCTTAPAMAGQADKLSIGPRSSAWTGANRELAAQIPGHPSTFPGERGAVADTHRDRPDIHGIFAAAVPEERVIAAETGLSCASPAGASHSSFGGFDRSGLADSWNFPHLSRDDTCAQG